MELIPFLFIGIDRPQHGRANSGLTLGWFHECKAEGIQVFLPVTLGLDFVLTLQADGHDCNSRGICNEGRCYCVDGFIGNSCEYKTCSNNCNNNGICGNDGKCICHEGFTGKDCSQKVCVNGCNAPQGECIDDICVCREGYYGIDCGKKKCKNDCNHNGICHEGECYCKEGYGGNECSVILN